jgi:hypothetical protein
MNWTLPLLFFGVAFIYSMVGFGGGSSYIALLALTGFPYDRIPPVALACNIVVVTGGVYHFARARHFNWGLFWPFMVGSVPMAFVGGRLPLREEVFLALLGTTLTVAGLMLLKSSPNNTSEADTVHPPGRVACLATGAGLGLLSGMVGIGGGIFLAPLLLHLRWATAKQVAAVSAMFILVNSLSGLTGQLSKNPRALADWDWLVLVGAVLVAGQLGSHLGARRFSGARVRQLTGLVVLAAGGRILWQAIT